MNFVKFTHKRLCFQSSFPVILRIYELECHDQTSVKVALVMCGPTFIKFMKLKKLENENLDVKLRYFLFLNNSLFYGVKFAFKVLFRISIDVIRFEHRTDLFPCR